MKHRNARLDPFRERKNARAKRAKKKGEEVRKGGKWEANERCKASGSVAGNEIAKGNLLFWFFASEIQTRGHIFESIKYKVAELQSEKEKLQTELEDVRCGHPVPVVDPPATCDDPASQLVNRLQRNPGFRRIEVQSLYLLILAKNGKCTRAYVGEYSQERQKNPYYNFLYSHSNPDWTHVREYVTGLT